jgi:nitroimidazol reductase NimA-like FMN-containing flavoprotein (pyridoxamine 5'-phosphate oxidase superfamily)
MQRKDKEINDPEILEEILNKSRVCRIALNDDEFPYIVPFNYGYGDHVLYFHSAITGKKIDLIRKNNKACFEIEFDSQVMKHEQACQWTTKYRSVIGYGIIELLTGREEKIMGLDRIMSHYGRSASNLYDEKQLENMVILKLTILKMTGKQSGSWEV